MKWMSRIFLVAALCLLWVLGAMVSRESRRTPAESLAVLQKELAGGRYDRDLMLGKLELVVREAERAGAADVVADSCLARGKVLMELGAFDRARTDIERVLEARPDDLGLQQMLIDLECRAGDHQRGLARVHAMLDRDPNYGAGWVSLGRLHREAAEAALKKSKDKIQRTLIAEDAAKAIRWVERMSSMDPTDPRRVALGHDLRKLFGVADEALCEETTRAADAASEDLRQARIALARSFAAQFDVTAFASLLELYKGAGQLDHALDLGMAALHIPAVRQDPKVATFMMRSLLERDRTRAAADIAAWWINRNQVLPAEFFLDCCAVFYRAHAWPQLFAAASEVFRTGNPTQTDHAMFYFGAALCEQGDYPPVRVPLQNYINSTSPEVFPGSIAAAWRLRAVAARDPNSPAPELEREALEGSLSIDSEQDGAMWLRLAELQLASPHGGFRLPETRFAKGMSLLPHRTAELLPRWTEIGNEELKSIGIDLDRVRSEFQQGRTWEPTGNSGPYEIYSLARIHFEAADYTRARFLARRLLQMLPKFLPALDLWLDIEQAEGFPHGWRDALLERLDVVGADARNMELLRSIAVDDLDARQIMRMMRADPEHFGRRIIARGLAKQGLPEQALNELELVGEQLISDEERVLGARLWLDLGKSTRALNLLLPLRATLADHDDAVAPMLEAMLASGKVRDAEAVTSELALAPAPERARWLALSDLLLAHGAALAAENLLLPLDREARLRGGDVLTRLAHAALIRGDAAGVQTILDRVHAFETGGRAEWVQLLEHAQAGRWDEVAEVALTLHATSLGATARADALLNVLARRLGLARTQIAAALQDAPDDPQWNLIAAAVDVIEGVPVQMPPRLGSHAVSGAHAFLASSSDPADVRRRVCILVALEEPSTIGWATKELGDLVRADPHALWATFLQGVASRARNDRSGMRNAFERVITDHPDFAPAWDGLQDLLPQGEPGVGDWIDFRLRRAVSLGENSGTPAERMFDRALAAVRQGKLRIALRDAREAAALDETSGVFQWQIGRLSRQLGDVAGAVRAYSKACRLLPQIPGLESTGEFLDVLAEAGRPSPPAVQADSKAGRLLPEIAGLESTGEFLDVLAQAGRPSPPVISLTERMRELDDLAARIPDDPRIAVALAGLDLAQDTRNPTLAVARAYQRLDAFRARHPAMALERLARGSTAAWAEFLLRLDPERAESFLRRELELEPGTLAAWVYIGRVRFAMDEFTDAAREFGIAERLSRDPAVLRESLRVRLSGAITQAELDDYVARIIAAERRATPDSELDLLRAQFYLRAGGASVARALEILEPLRGRQDIQTSLADRFGLLYASALNARGTPEDLAKVEPLLAETTPWLTDPYHQNLAQVLLGLSRQTSVQVSN